MDWKEFWKTYGPYFKNDMVYTFVIMVVIFIIAFIFIF